MCEDRGFPINREDHAKPPPSKGAGEGDGRSIGDHQDVSFSQDLVNLGASMLGGLLGLDCKCLLGQGWVEEVGVD
jgi:hypothetical protein